MIKEYQTHQTVVTEGSCIMMCRLKLLDTIASIPVLRLQLGKSVLKGSKVPLNNCLEYVFLQILLLCNPLFYKGLMNS